MRSGPTRRAASSGVRSSTSNDVTIPSHADANTMSARPLITTGTPARRHRALTSRATTTPRPTGRLSRRSSTIVTPPASACSTMSGSRSGATRLASARSTIRTDSSTCTFGVGSSSEAEWVWELVPANVSSRVGQNCPGPFDCAASTAAPKISTPATAADARSTPLEAIAPMTASITPSRSGIKSRTAPEEMFLVQVS